MGAFAARFASLPSNTFVAVATGLRNTGRFADLPLTNRISIPNLGLNMKIEPLQDAILTLQYCLETFELTCQCGRCDPCIKGQKDIVRSIRRLERLQLRQRKLRARRATSLTRKGVASAAP